jgi:hypothetical protein
MSVKDRLVKLESIAKNNDVYTKEDGLTIRDYLKVFYGDLPMTEELQHRLDDLNNRRGISVAGIEEIIAELESECWSMNIKTRLENLERTRNRKISVREMTDEELLIIVHGAPDEAKAETLNSYWRWLSLGLYFNRRHHWRHWIGIQVKQTAHKPLTRFFYV